MVVEPLVATHVTNTPPSWLKAAEGFVAKGTRRQLKGGVFHSIVDLQAATRRFLHMHDQTP